LAKKASVTGATCINQNPLAIGAKNVPAKDITEAFFNSTLDDGQVYTNPLSATQIQAAMNQP
jgi:hypothetical protein